ncbi:hypothetical protein Trydic_g18124 [Trypoxylus dichotomus]
MYSSFPQQYRTPKFHLRGTNNDGGDESLLAEESCCPKEVPTLWKSSTVAIVTLKDQNLLTKACQSKINKQIKNKGIQWNLNEIFLTQAMRIFSQAFL